MRYDDLNFTKKCLIFCICIFVNADFRLSGKGLAGLAGYTDLTEEEKAEHRFSRKLPDKAENFKVYYKNKYGVWTHLMKKI